MNQKKHMNAIAALEASKDADPGLRWELRYCRGQDCFRCYVPGNYMCHDIDNGKSVSEVRAALQSGLDAYHKRKAEKAERREEAETITCMQPASADPAPLIPDPPDTPEVRAIIEKIAVGGCGINNPACKDCPFLEDDRCTGPSVSKPLASSWLSRHPAVWDAEKGRFTLAERCARMRKWAEAVIKHYPIPDEDAATVWLPGMMDSRLLADEVIAYLADEARRQGWKR